MPRKPRNPNAVPRVRKPQKWVSVSITDETGDTPQVLSNTTVTAQAAGTELPKLRWYINHENFNGLTVNLAGRVLEVVPAGKPLQQTAGLSVFSPPLSEKKDAPTE